MLAGFAELPGDCCLKVNVDEYEGDTLLEYMIALTSNEKLKNTLGKKARNYIFSKHNPDTIAQEYYSFIKNILEGNEYIMNTMSARLYETGVHEYELIRYSINNLKEPFLIFFNF